MTPVFQRTKNDCLTAAIATITGIPYEECPQLWEFTGDEWLERLTQWARSNNLGVVYFSCPNQHLTWPIFDNFLCIVAGSTRRSSEYGHCVVARAEWEDRKTTRLVYVHDPLKGGDYIQEPEFGLFFVRNLPSIPANYCQTCAKPHMNCDCMP